MHSGGPAPHHNSAYRGDDNGHRNGEHRNRLLGIVLCVHGLVAQLSIVERTLYSAPPGRVTCTIYTNSISWTSLRRPLRQSVSILALRPFLKQLSPPGRFRMWGIIKVSLKRKMSSPFPGSQWQAKPSALLTSFLLAA